MANIAFLTFEFTKHNLRKQPWNYVYKICKKLRADGHNVVIITDGSPQNTKKQLIYDIPVYRTSKIRPWALDTIIEVIENASIHLILWSFTPRSIAFYYHFKKLGRPMIFFMSVPLYDLKQIIKAQKILGRYNLNLFYQNCLVPKFALRRIINSALVHGIITPTLNNRRKLIQYGCESNKVFYVPHGRDSQCNETSKKYELDTDYLQNIRVLSLLRNTNKKIILYMGGPQKIRGLNWLITAFSKVIAHKKDIHLIVLLRTDNEADFQAIETQCRENSIYENTTIVHGILSPEEVKAYVATCHFVVLPFILVPSEIPISILESMEAGKPVIATNVDGIPELITNRGIVVQPGDTHSLRQAILKLAIDDSYRRKLSKNCKSYMKHYPTWHSTLSQIQQLIQDTKC
jgi:glycosyltransferase involved in cell wall biosynthesis